MVELARNYACGRASPPCTTWNYDADATDPMTKPAQKGLAYVYGGKTPLVRTLPSDGCTQELHGVDCSGLISLIASAVGVTPPSGSSAQASAEAWGVPSDWKLKMTAVTDGTIETGDLLFWNTHVGIAEANGSNANLISSTGAPNTCALNLKKGPRSLSVSQLGLGAPTKVLRLVAILSGNWQMGLRCSGQTTDVATLQMTLDNDKGGPFTTNGSGTDYTGGPLQFRLDGTYDQTANVMSATLTLTNGNRQDSFVQKLLTDSIDYFPLTKVVDNGGCPALASLKRVQATIPNGVPTQSHTFEFQSTRSSALNQSFAAH